MRRGRMMGREYGFSAVLIFRNIRVNTYFEGGIFGLPLCFFLPPMFSRSFQNTTNDVESAVQLKRCLYENLLPTPHLRRYAKGLEMLRPLFYNLSENFVAA